MALSQGHCSNDMSFVLEQCTANFRYSHACALFTVEDCLSLLDLVPAIRGTERGIQDRAISVVLVGCSRLTRRRPSIIRSALQVHMHKGLLLLNKIITFLLQ